ncbi:hypothetical protein [Bradyrhizobium sp. AUGA SZCCT0431]|uniref:hypothetical protein n=1 Tax=Bradyrhizobium sp. AUGA SZCCT0431 TaxID=2807674 RepID=UPI001BA5883C|nr:hypothetical protein [Bradyrhizobium sp. AUGA SZCCT0431]MBR1143755.1 hypothetical protein [Bradyrhizobium sp. AUGA SZCCT0431]
MFAIVLALVGGLSLFNKANDDTKPPAAVAEAATAGSSNCHEFEANARKLFDQGGDTATLSGAFAPGDQVHLVIDFNGVSYAWESTGVLGKMPNVSGSRWFSWLSGYKYTARTRATYSPEHTLISSVSDGKISGFAKLEVKLDVATAGDGAITIKKTGSGLLPKVVIANCKPSKQTPAITRQLSS